MSLLTLARRYFGATEFNELEPSELLAAFNDPAVRRHWMRAVLYELAQLNMGVEKALEHPAPAQKIAEVAARRRQTLNLLQQIETSRNSVEMDEHHNPEIDLDRVAVQSVPGK